MLSPSPCRFTTASDFLKYLGNLEALQSYTWAGISFLIGLVIYAITQSKSPIDAIPAVGGTGFFTSYISAMRYAKHAKAMLKKGHDESKVFRVPELFRWRVIISDEALIDEFRKASDDTFSFEEAVREDVASDYTLGRNISKNQYHIAIVRGKLTRNLGNVFPDIRDEIVRACDDKIPLEDEWIKVKVLDTVTKVISRASNRVFVGVPTCRDPEYIELNVRFTINVSLGAWIIKLFPAFLRPLVGRMLTNVPKDINTGLKHLRPIIEERQRKIDEYGFDYPDKPNDMLSWLMDEAKGEARTAEDLTRRILTLNFAAIHTTSLSFTHALYSLATYPHHIGPLRAEIEAAVAEEGWTKASLGRMRKLDSFLKESQRHGTGDLTMHRKVLRPYTFSDRTFLPKGAMVSVYISQHKSETVYPNAEEFDGFRFSDLREKEGEGTKHQFVATSMDYMPFGHGRHACPGRFFAANTLKLMMAHLILAYDFKLEKEGVRPPDEKFGTMRIPNRTAEMFFRKRQK